MENVVAVALVDGEGRVLLERAGAADEGWALPSGFGAGGDGRAVAGRIAGAITGGTVTALRQFGRFAAGELGEGAATVDFWFGTAEIEIPPSRSDRYQFARPDDLGERPVRAATRALLERLRASDRYRGLAAMQRPGAAAVAVLGIDRWGRVLLQLRDDDLPPERHPGTWSFCGGFIEEGESPDAAALREFEEETGALLPGLKFFGLYRPGTELPRTSRVTQHVYYFDADLDEESLSVNEGQALKYFGPAEFERLALPADTRLILGQFFASTHYRAMFH